MPAPSPARKLYLLAERHRAPRAQIIGAVAERLARDLGAPVPAALAALHPEQLSTACRSEFDALFDRHPLAAHDDPLGWVIEALEGRRAHRTTHQTPPALVRLMLDLAGDVTGTVYDPAAGTGALLLAAAARNPGVTLVGQEIDPVSHACAAINAELAGIEINLGRPGDTLSEPQHPALAADLVLANPPWKRLTNRAWVEHCLSALTADGRAVLLLPASVCTDQQGGLDKLSQATHYIGTAPPSRCSPARPIQGHRSAWRDLDDRTRCPGGRRADGRRAQLGRRSATRWCACER
ncbi:hypothetical protein D3229_06565 [Leucobacter aridicollis]|nr:hypothetical protein [Leucobacter aridicollis]